MQDWRLVEECKIGDKHRFDILKGKGNSNYRERYCLIPMDGNMVDSTGNLRGKQMHPDEVERRRQVNIVERMDMWRSYVIRRATIYRRRSNALKERRPMYN
jgi:hypothetical protein